MKVTWPSNVSPGKARNGNLGGVAPICTRAMLLLGHVGDDPDGGEIGDQEEHRRLPSPSGPRSAFFSMITPETGDGQSNDSGTSLARAGLVDACCGTSRVRSFCSPVSKAARPSGSLQAKAVVDHGACSISWL